MNFSKYDFKITESLQVKKKLISYKPKVNTELRILMPPPNITGNLHLGHSLDLTIQDFIVRYHLLRGKNIKWITGFDHAGIATQSKIEKLNLDLNSNAEKRDFTLSKWYPRQCEVFKRQWSELGLFLNYKDNYFTMDSDFQFYVEKYFIDLYNDGFIYQNTRIVNWDFKLKSVISDIEVDYKDTENKLFFVEYLLDNSNEKKKIIVATSRPETIFADVALFVNPDDNRYLDFIGKFAINPLSKKTIPIFSSKKVDINFGTGVLKCTPGHDFKDYELAKEINLPIIFCYNQDGKFNELAGEWEGKKVEIAKLEIIDYLRERKIILKEEKYNSRIAYSQRSGEKIDTIISSQWFLNLPLMIKKIEESNPNFLKEIKFIPSKNYEILIDWKNKVKDWCISRQLWWGHYIPIWYNFSRKEKKIFVGKKPPFSFKWEKNSDVLDTWFSSSLIPIITKNLDFSNDFLSIDYLITGSDLLFFWVFKMIVFSFYFNKKPPFKSIYIHGLIRNKDGKKMSKSIGNGIEPEKIISNYGADSLRLFLLSNNNFNNDLIFDESKLKGCYFFLQKIWSIFNFISLHIDKKDLKKISLKEIEEVIEEDLDNNSKILNFWIINELFKIKKKYFKDFEDKLDTSSIAKYLIDFSKEKISNSYIYILKYSYKKSNLLTLLYVFQQTILLLNPFVPFITGYIYKKICNQELMDTENIEIVYNKFDNFDFSIINLIFTIKNKIISFCKEYKIRPSEISFQIKILDNLNYNKFLINDFFLKLKKNENINVFFSWF